MPLDCPHIYDLGVPRGAGLRCKRKLSATDNMEECTIVYKKEKLEELSVQYHWGTTKENHSGHSLQHTQAHEDHSRQHRLEGSMDIGMEVVHNSVPVWNIPPARPSTPPQQIGFSAETGKSLSPMMGVEDVPGFCETVCDNKPSNPFELDNRIEFCSFQCSGAPRSPVSNRIRCLCRGPYDQPDEQHYVSDIY